jgi:hypothetical protein
MPRGPSEVRTILDTVRAAKIWLFVASIPCALFFFPWLPVSNRHRDLYSSSSTVEINFPLAPDTFYDFHNVTCHTIEANTATNPMG